MRILVTGAAGFIGGHLVPELEHAGHDVWGVDRPDGDLTAPGVARELVRHAHADVVIHLAAQVGRQFGEDDVAHAVRSNALMTTYMAQACAAAGARLVYASTSEVYGDQGDQLCHEDGPLALPHNLYGLSKRWGEEAARLYAPAGLQVLRFSMPYGPGAPPGRGRRALDNVLWQAHHRMPIPVHRGATRSWCWVGDVVRGVRLIVESGEAGTWNVGRDDDEVSMLRVADRACELTRAPRSLIEVVSPPERQTVIKRLSTRRLRRLGWRPTVELEDGMVRVLDWVRQFDAEGQLVAA